MFRTKEKLAAIFVALITFLTTLILGFVTMLGVPQTALSAKAEGESYYEKVTTAPDDWSGTYLIVYEAGNVAFDGNRTTLDAASNTVAVTINDGQIAYTEDLDKSTFTISSSDGSVKSASGYYIGQTSNANGLKSSTSTTYENTISLNSDGSVNFVSGGAYLRYNAASDQKRFRYYKSSSYTNQKAICLYKYVEGTTEGGEGGSTETPTPPPTECEHVNKILQYLDGQAAHIYFCPDCQQQVGEKIDCDWNNGACECGSTKPAEPTVYTLVTDVNKLQIGSNVVIVANDYNYALSTTQKDNNRAQAAVTKNTTDNTVTFGDDVQILTLEEGTVDGTFAFYTGVDASTVGYLYAASSSSNHLKTQTTLNDNGSWKIEINENGVATVKAQGTSTRNWLRYNSTNNPPIFSCYASGQQDISIYADPTTLNNCAHSNTTTTTVDATCTTDGSTTVTCNDCGATVSTEVILATGHTNGAPTTVPATCTEPETTIVSCSVCEVEISRTVNGEALGHSWNEGETTKEPTETETGEITYTCTRDNCGETKTETIPTLTVYTVTFSVLGNTETVEAVTDGKGKTFTLPEPDSLPMGITFVGWVKDESTSENKNVLTGEYTIQDADETLYALVSYTKGEKAPQYTKVTEAPADWSGNYLIVYEDGNVAFNGGLTTLDGENNTVAVSINNGVIKVTEEMKAAQFTIEKSGTNYTIKSASGYYIGRTSSSNGLDTNGETNYTHALEIDADGNAKITASGGCLLRFNDASNQMRFRYYASGQKAIQLYKLEGDQETVYTTTLNAAFVGASLTIGQDLTMNYYANVYAELQNISATFTVDGETVEVKGDQDETGRYVFLLPLPPQCMADNISAVLYADGTEIARMDRYSVREYAISLLQKESSDAELKALVSELLRYGAAAQSYVGHNTEDLATNVEDGLLSAEIAVADVNDVFTLETAPEATAEDCSSYIAGVGVHFDNVNKIFLRFAGDLEGVTVDITRNGTEAVTGATLTGAYLYTDGIYATAFDDTFTFTVKVNGVHTQTLTYSVNSYVANLDSDKEGMTELANALYRYGKAATAYLTALNGGDAE